MGQGQDAWLNIVETPLAPAHVIVDLSKRCAETWLVGIPQSSVKKHGKNLAFVMATQPNPPEK